MSARSTGPWPGADRFYLASPGRTGESPWRLDGAEAAACIKASGPGRFRSLRRQADALFATLRDDGASPSLLIGGIEFGEEGAARFVLPGHGTSLPNLTPALRVDPSPIGEGCSIRELDPDYADRVSLALAEITRGALRKVVLARRLEVTRANPFTLEDFLTRADEPDSLHFCLERDDALFVGQTPERLLRVSDGVAESDALAGTAPLSEPSDALLRSEKDRREHTLVVERLRERLSRWGEVTASEPFVRSFRTVHHLATSVRCRLDRPAHILELAEALHPTPALGGEPREAALDWIRLHEAPRGLYGGLIGWFDRDGNGELWVGIRSALLTGNRAIIHAGAGIVAGSSPSTELAETTSKAASILRALGVYS